MIFDIFKRWRENAGAVSHTNGKPRAVAFVDYEHWYISLDNMYHIKPDIKAWRDEITSKYDVGDIIFFADFSNPSLRGEISRIREVSNVIIETGNTSSHYKKDFTGFIMLDHIYQKAMSQNDIDTFIIFTGDGHFSSVVSFITSRLSKKVGIYAVRDALSGQLRGTASWAVELPVQDEHFITVSKLIFNNLKYLEEQNRSKVKKSLPTFWGTVDAVARFNHIARNEISDTMRTLIERGYIFQTEQAVTSTAENAKKNASDRRVAAKNDKNAAAGSNNADIKTGVKNANIKNAKNVKSDKSEKAAVQNVKPAEEKNVKIICVRWDKVKRDGMVD